EAATRVPLLDGGAAEGAQRAGIGGRHGPLADGVHAADPGAEHRARVPADLVVTARGTGETGVLPGLDRGHASEPVVRVHGQELVGVEERRGQLIDALRNSSDLTAEAQLAQPGDCSHPGAALAQRLPERRHPDTGRRHPADAREAPPPGHAGTPTPARVPEQTAVPSSSLISTSERMRRRRKSSLRPWTTTRCPGRTIPVNSTWASVKSVTGMASAPLRPSR